MPEFLSLGWISPPSCNTWVVKICTVDIIQKWMYFIDNITDFIYQPSFFKVHYTCYSPLLQCDSLYLLFYLMQKHFNILKNNLFCLNRGVLLQCIRTYSVAFSKNLEGFECVWWKLSLSLAQIWYQASRNSFLNKECAVGSEHWLVTGVIKPCNVWRYIRMYHHLSVLQLPFIVFVSILCHMETTHW